MTRKEKLIALQAQRQTAIDAADKLLAMAKDESLTPEDTAACDKHLKDVEDCGHQITALAKEEIEIAVKAAALEVARKAPISPEVAAIVNRGSGMSAMPPGATAERWTIPATARKALSKLTAFADDRTGGGYSSEEKAYRFGQWALAKAERDRPDLYTFQAATKFCNDQGLLRNAHYEGGTDTTGSHLFVPEEFGTDLIMLRETYGAARKLCKMVPMKSDTRTDPRWVSGLTSAFTGEGAAMTESSVQFNQVRLTAKKMTALAIYSSELDEDSVMDFAQMLAMEIGRSDALKEDQCLIDGDGTSTYGHIRGLKAMFATTTLGTNPGYRDTTTSNTWAAIVIADLTSLIAQVPVYAQQGMKFLCSSQFYYQVMVPLLQAAGGVTGTEMQSGFRTPMFQGIPVVFSQAMPVATATSSLPVYLGNFELGASFGDRRQSSVQFSREATVAGINLFDKDMIAIKSSQRIDMNIHGIGSDTAAGPILALSTGS